MSISKHSLCLVIIALLWRSSDQKSFMDSPMDKGVAGHSLVQNSHSDHKRLVKSDCCSLPNHRKRNLEKLLPRRVDAAAEPWLLDYLPKFKTNNLVPSTIYILQSMAGVFLILFGGRHARVNIILFGFLIGYFFLSITFVQFDFYKTFGLRWQFLLMLFAVFVGFLTSIATHLDFRSERIVVGLALTLPCFLFAAQFYVDFDAPTEWSLCALGYLMSGALVGLSPLGARRWLTVVAAPFVGAAMLTVSCGVLSQHITSYEEEGPYLPRRTFWLSWYISLAAALAGIGLAVQAIGLCFRDKPSVDESFDEPIDLSFNA